MMAMMAMVLQLSVPLGQGLVASAFANGQDDTAMPLMICSTLGGVSHTLDGQTPQSPDGPSVPCMFCLVSCQMKSASEIVPPSSFLLAPVQQAVVWTHGNKINDVCISKETAVRHCPRAPPSFTG